MQAPLVDTLGQLIAGRLDLMSGELGDGIIQGPKVAILVLGALRTIPENLNLVDVTVSNDLALLERLQNAVSLVVVNRDLSKASKDFSRLAKGINRTLNNVDQLGHVEVVAMLLRDGILILKCLEAIEARQPENAHLERDAARPVERVVENQTQAEVVANLGQLDQMVFEIVLNIHASTVAHDVRLALEVAKAVVGKGILDGVDKGLVLNQSVTVSADTQHLLGVGAAVAKPATVVALGGEELHGFHGVIKGVIHFWFLFS